MVLNGRKSEAGFSWMWAAFLKPSLIYILKTADSERTEIIDVIKNEIPERSDEIVTVADKLRQEGRQEGAASNVERLLKNKFSSELTEELIDKLYKPDQNKLNEITDNIFEIEDLEIVKGMLVS